MVDADPGLVLTTELAAGAGMAAGELVPQHVEETAAVPEQQPSVVMPVGALEAAKAGPIETPGEVVNDGATVVVLQEQQGVGDQASAGESVGDTPEAMQLMEEEEEEEEPVQEVGLAADRPRRQIKRPYFLAELDEPQAKRRVGSTPVQEKDSHADENASDDGQAAKDGDSDDSDEEEKVYCICRKPDLGGRKMIACDGFCFDWYHPECVGLSKKQLDQLQAEDREYICDACTAQFGADLPTRRAARRAQVEGPRSQAKPSRPPPKAKKEAQAGSRSNNASRKRTAPEPKGETRVAKKLRPSCQRAGCAKEAAVESEFCSDECMDAHATDIFQALLGGGAAQSQSGSQVAERKEYAPSPSSRRASMPSEAGNVGPAKPRSAGREVTIRGQRKFDPLRNRVVSTLEEALVKRCAGTQYDDKEALHQLSDRIESCLHEVCDNQVDQKYKNKYRSLLFNLGNVKNTSLYVNVVSGVIQPEELVQLSAQELADSKLQQAREEIEKKAADNYIVKELQIVVSNTKHMDRIPAHLREEALLGSRFADNKADAAAEVAHTPERVGSPGQPVDEGASVEPTAAGMQSPDSADIEANMDMELDGVALSAPMPFAPAAATATKAPSRAVSKADQTVKAPATLPAAKEPQLWAGQAIMSDMVKARLLARRLYGRPDTMLGDMLPEVLNIQGRISHSRVWSYLAKLKYSTTKEIFVADLEPPADSDEVDFISFFSYFSSRKRCGVLGTIHKTIKDMYIVPLNHNEPLPPALLECGLDGPGLSQDKPDDRLLAIFILNVGSSAARKHHHRPSQPPLENIPLPDPSDLEHASPEGPDASPSFSPDRPYSPSQNVVFDDRRDVYSPTQDLDLSLGAPSTQLPFDAPSPPPAARTARIASDLMADMDFNSIRSALATLRQAAPPDQWTAEAPPHPYSRAPPQPPQRPPPPLPHAQMPEHHDHRPPSSSRGFHDHGPASHHQYLPSQQRPPPPQQQQRAYDWGSAGGWPPPQQNHEAPLGMYHGRDARPPRPQQYRQHPSSTQWEPRRKH